MKLINFRTSRGPSLGVVDGDSVVDLAVARPDLPIELDDLFRLGEEALEAALGASNHVSSAARLPLEGISYLPPAGRRGKIICLGRNYSEHAAEGGHPPPEYPMIFLRSTTSLVAHEEAIVRPNVSDQLDFEGELVAFIGKPGKNVPEDRALDIVAGYSVFNDGSLRDYQRINLVAGKNFDSTGGFGPAFVPASQLPPGGKDLRLQTRLNGRIVQNASTSEMIFDVAQTIAILSQVMTLEPGDLLMMGTPSGVGAARKPPLFMKPGDICEVEIEGVGLLRNRIVHENRI